MARRRGILIQVQPQRTHTSWAVGGSGTACGAFARAGIQHGVVGMDDFPCLRIHEIEDSVDALREHGEHV